MEKPDFRPMIVFGFIIFGMILFLVSRMATFIYIVLLLFGICFWEANGFDVIKYVFHRIKSGK